MEFGIRVLLLLAAAVFFLISIFSDVHWNDFLAVGLILVALAMVVEATPLGKKQWSTDDMGGRSRSRQ